MTLPRRLVPTAAALAGTALLTLGAVTAPAQAGLPRTIGPGQAVRVDGVRLEIKGRVTDGQVGEGDTRLVVTDDGERLRAPTPLGSTPRLFTRIAAFGPEKPGYVIKQTYRDGVDWTVFALDRAGRLVAAREPERPVLGSTGTVLDGEFAELRTRFSERGLTTVITSEQSDARAVYDWRLVSRDGVPTLVARRR